MQISQLLRQNIRPKPNITKDERNASKSLRADPTIHILPADRGNATVVMDVAQYNEKILHLLNTPTYRRIKKARLMPSKEWLQASYSDCNTIRNVYLESTDTLVSFDIKSLFTNVPVEEACLTAKHRLEEDHTLQERTDLNPQQINDLLLQCLVCTNFKWLDQFFEQTEGTAMGSPLSLVIANIFLEEFEQLALLSVTKQPKLWLRYVDGTFIIGQHSKVYLDGFIDHLNSQHKSIMFTMEEEHNRSLTFLDVLVTRPDAGTWSHAVYRKPTHTDRYLNKRLFHHPSTKKGVCNTLIKRAHCISDHNSIRREVQHVKAALKLNGYHTRDIATPRPSNRLGNADSRKYVCLPYLVQLSHRIQHILLQADVKVFHNAPNKLSRTLQTHKEKPPAQSQLGVYRISCECGKVYIGETGRDLRTRLKEHQGHARRGEQEKSSIALPSITPNTLEQVFEKQKSLALTYFQKNGQDFGESFKECMTELEGSITNEYPHYKSIIDRYLNISFGGLETILLGLGLGLEPSGLGLDLGLGFFHRDQQQK
ncbi:uncharacterized protein LOC117101698 [Anneissia japonica]|uniref:uncharacterized protein LOC117101698 n=1 Tax=Anneissia japonica TaxID=1529436 RepID=UPI00142577E2|nr:uncharacterized protein LOC117101698 [Anneissia japonica]